MPTILCPLCYRDVTTNSAGLISPHAHTPLLSGAVCLAGGLTSTEARAAAVAEVRRWRESHQKKVAK